MKNKNHKTKILYLITKGNWGGAQRYVYDLASSLPQDEFEPVVAFGEGEILPKKLSETEVRNVRVRALRRAPGCFDLVAFLALFRLIRKESLDVIHLNSSKAAALGAVAARLAGVPNIIFTAHGWSFKEHRSSLARMMIHAATWLTILFCHKTIVVSKEDEMLGKRMWFVSGKITYIPIALRPIPMRFLPRETAETILFVHEPHVDLHVIHSIRLVTIAELTKNKGVQYGIDMMKELEKRFPGTYTYTIFGEGEDLPYLQRHAQGLLNSQKQPIVLFRSIATNVPPDLSTEASRYLKAFDIFVLPSIKEGMPYVLLEAAAAELPIVATNVVEEEASDLPTIRFVSPKDGQALALAIQNLRKSASAKTEGVARSFPAMLAQTITLYRA